MCDTSRGPGRHTEDTKVPLASRQGSGKVRGVGVKRLVVVGGYESTPLLRRSDRWIQPNQGADMKFTKYLDAQNKHYGLTGFLSGISVVVTTGSLGLGTFLHSVLCALGTFLFT